MKPYLAKCSLHNAYLTSQQLKKGGCIDPHKQAKYAREQCIYLDKIDHKFWTDRDNVSSKKRALRSGKLMGAEHNQILLKLKSLGFDRVRYNHETFVITCELKKSKHFITSLSSLVDSINTAFSTKMVDILNARAYLGKPIIIMFRLLPLI